MPPASDFLSGVIEGFYGQPWSHAERLELFDWMRLWGLNTYLYAPKDDLKHRAIWREAYSAAEAERLGELIRASKEKGIRFIYAISPGLDIRYSNPAELQTLRNRIAQTLELGCENFALLFDDISDRMDPEDAKRFGSFAAAQAHVANTVFAWTRERNSTARFLFCPTPYCSRMARAELGGPGYLATIGRELSPEIDVFWTGPEIISHEITVNHVRELQSLLRRKPLIWDNLHANDYDSRRFFCGPYSGRPQELRDEVSGLLTNPNSEFLLNYVPLRTMGEFLRSNGAWEPRAAFLSALHEWIPRFASQGKPLSFEDLVLYFDCYYLPHEDGPGAEDLYQRIELCIRSDPKPSDEEVRGLRARLDQLREICVRLTELRDRSLFYALSRRLWELREEMALLEGFVESKSRGKGVFTSDYHLPGTYRGGMVARLQRLLTQEGDGTLKPTI